MTCELERQNRSSTYGLKNDEFGLRTQGEYSVSLRTRQQPPTIAEFLYLIAPLIFVSDHKRLDTFSRVAKKNAAFFCELLRNKWGHKGVERHRLYGEENHG